MRMSIPAFGSVFFSRYVAAYYSIAMSKGIDMFTLTHSPAPTLTLQPPIFLKFTFFNFNVSYLFIFYILHLFHKMKMFIEG